jgi:hypothetical protein
MLQLRALKRAFEAVSSKGWMDVARMKKGMQNDAED